MTDRTNLPPPNPGRRLTVSSDRGPVRVRFTPSEYHPGNVATNVVSFEEARRLRDEQEERRLEQLVIERWTGKSEDDP